MIPQTFTVDEEDYYRHVLVSNLAKNIFKLQYPPLF